MEGKSRNILVVLIALVIAVAVFSSFGMDLFSGGIPRITPPPVLETAEPGTSGAPAGPDGDLIRVSVTPETVQNVIATLARPASYYREVTVEYSGTGGAVRSKIWADNGWTRTDSVLPGGTVRHSIVGDGTVYYWYGGSRTWASAPADENSADLEGSRIPTYEDVLSEDPEHIIQADYVDLDGTACIYVAVKDEELNSVSQYWVGVDSGLLSAARRVTGEETVLSMTSTAVERPVPAQTGFILPDGTVLHTVQG